MLASFSEQSLQRTVPVSLIRLVHFLLMGPQLPVKRCHFRSDRPVLPISMKTTKEQLSRLGSFEYSLRIHGGLYGLVCALFCPAPPNPGATKTREADLVVGLLVSMARFQASPNSRRCQPYTSYLVGRSPWLIQGGSPSCYGALNVPPGSAPNQTSVFR